MRVAIVNDLVLAREVLRRLVLSVPEHVIAWTADNGEEAVRKAARDRPDVILMDLVMPVLDGVEATRRIMADSPCPILLVTSSVTGNFNLVYRAMGYGGLDAVNTPTLGPQGTIQNGEGLLARIAQLARAQQAPAWPPPGQTCPAPGGGARPNAALPGPALLALGASTGGPEAIAYILKALPGDFPAAVIVVQHIAADFAPSLVRWLQGWSSLPIRLGSDGDAIEPGTVLVAGTDDHLVVRRDLRVAYTADPVECPYRPSVDVFFNSLALVWPRPGVAVLLTGMGSDGARGLLCLRQHGWRTIAQGQAGCVVYGMPRAAVECGAAAEVLPLAQVPASILDHLTTR